MDDKNGILILDDESTLRESMADFLEEYSFNVLTADSAEDGIRILQQVPSIFLAIVDLRLPGMDGIEFIKKMHKRYTQLKFIIHTGSLNYNLDQELEEMGLTHEDIFFKPVTDLVPMLETIQRKTH